MELQEVLVIKGVAKSGITFFKVLYFQTVFYKIKETTTVAIFHCTYLAVVYVEWNFKKY